MGVRANLQEFSPRIWCFGRTLAQSVTGQSLCTIRVEYRIEICGRTSPPQQNLSVLFNDRIGNCGQPACRHERQGPGRILPRGQQIPLRSVVVSYHSPAKIRGEYNFATGTRVANSATIDPLV